MGSDSGVDPYLLRAIPPKVLSLFGRIEDALRNREAIRAVGAEHFAG